MAVVYENCNEKAAHSADSRRGMEAAVMPLAATVVAVHAAHHYEGHSYVEVHSEHLNHYIMLHDEQGDSAAAAIEYGRLGNPGIAALQSILGG